MNLKVFDCVVSIRPGGESFILVEEKNTLMVMFAS